MGEEEDQQTSDEIESVERIRNYPMFSPPRVLLLTGDDLEQSPSLELSGFHFGFDAYLPPPPTTSPIPGMSTDDWNISDYWIRKYIRLNAYLTRISTTPFFTRVFTDDCTGFIKLVIEARQDKFTKLFKELIALEEEERARKLFQEVIALEEECEKKVFFPECFQLFNEVIALQELFKEVTAFKMKRELKLLKKDIALEKRINTKCFPRLRRLLFSQYAEPMMFVTETQHTHAAAHLAHFSPMAVGMGLGTMGMNGQSSITTQKGGTRFSAQWRPPVLGPASFEGMDESTLQVFGHPGQGLAISSPQAQLSRGPPIYLAERLNPNGTVAAAVEVPYSAPSSMSNDLMLNTPSHMLLHNTDAGTSMTPKSSQEYFLEEQRYVEIINPSTNENIHSRLQCMQLPLPPRSSLRPEAFPNGGEIEAASIGGNVASADLSCTAIFHSKKKNTTETPKRKCMTRRPVTPEDLQRQKGKKRADAAKTLGISVPTFKRVCRQNGILRWNGDECSPLKQKLVFNSVYENSPPEPQGVRTTLPSCKEGSIGAQAEIGNPMVESSLSAQEGRLQGRFDARIVIMKANYREDIVKFELSSASGIVELKEEVAKRLELELGSFNVKYQDEDRDWVLMACDADLHACVKFSSSLSNQPIRLRVTDKDSRKRCRGLKRKSSYM